MDPKYTTDTKARPGEMYHAWRLRIRYGLVPCLFCHLPHLIREIDTTGACPECRFTGREVQPFPPVDFPLAETVIDQAR